MKTAERVYRKWIQNGLDCMQDESKSGNFRDRYARLFAGWKDGDQAQAAVWAYECAPLDESEKDLLELGNLAGCAFAFAGGFNLELWDDEPDSFDFPSACGYLVYINPGSQSVLKHFSRVLVTEKDEQRKEIYALIRLLKKERILLDMKGFLQDLYSLSEFSDNRDSVLYRWSIRFYRSMYQMDASGLSGGMQESEQVMN